MTTELINQQRDRIAELEREKAELVARMAELNKLHSDLTNADMVLDDGEHSGYLITNEQIDEMDHLLSVDAQCLNQIKAEAVRDAANQLAKCITAPPGMHSSAVSALVKMSDNIRKGV